MELRVVFKQFAAWIHRFDGSLVNPSNISKVRLSDAAGIIVLSKLKTEDPDEEDSANLMNIMAIKVACPDMRIIVLLHRYKNKVSSLITTRFCLLVLSLPDEAVS